MKIAIYPEESIHKSYIPNFPSYASQYAGYRADLDGFIHFTEEDVIEGNWEDEENIAYYAASIAEENTSTYVTSY